MNPAPAAAAKNIKNAVAQINNPFPLGNNTKTLLENLREFLFFKKGLDNLPFLQYTISVIKILQNFLPMVDYFALVL